MVARHIDFQCPRRCDDLLDQVAEAGLSLNLGVIVEATAKSGSGQLQRVMPLSITSLGARRTGKFESRITSMIGPFSILANYLHLRDSVFAEGAIACGLAIQRAYRLRRNWPVIVQYTLLTGLNDDCREDSAMSRIACRGINCALSRAVHNCPMNWEDEQFFLGMKKFQWSLFENHLKSTHIKLH